MIKLKEKKIIDFFLKKTKPNSEIEQNNQST